MTDMWTAVKELGSASLASTRAASCARQQCTLLYNYISALFAQNRGHLVRRAQGTWPTRKQDDVIAASSNSPYKQTDNRGCHSDTHYPPYKQTDNRGCHSDPPYKQTDNRGCQSDYLTIKLTTEAVKVTTL